MCLKLLLLFEGNVLFFPLSLSSFSPPPPPPSPHPLDQCVRSLALRKHLMLLPFLLHNHAIDYFVDRGLQKSLVNLDGNRPRIHTGGHIDAHTHTD